MNAYLILDPVKQDGVRPGSMKVPTASFHIAPILLDPIYTFEIDSDSAPPRRPPGYGYNGTDEILL